MRLTVRGREFLRICQDAASIQPTRPTQPAYGCLKFEPGPTCLSVVSTAGHAGYRCSVSDGVEYQQGDPFLVPASRFVSLCWEHDGEDITIDTEAAGGVRIKADHASYVVPLAPVDHFPDPPPAPEEGPLSHWITLPADTFRGLLRKSLFAIPGMGDEATKKSYAMGGLVWSILKNRLEVAATDGGKLAVVSTDLPTKMLDMPLTLVPGGFLGRVQSIAERYRGEMVGICMAKQAAYFRIGEATVSTAYLEGRFPNYREIPPKSWPTKLEFLASDLHKIFRRVSAVKEGDGFCRAECSLDKGKFTVVSRSENQGEARIETEVASTKPAAWQLDVSKVTPWFRTIPAEATVTMECGLGEQEPIQFRWGADCRYMVMTIGQPGNAGAAK